jgi:L-lactate utilization protein LutB
MKKRFTSAQQISAEIDKRKKEFNHLLDLAQVQEGLNRHEDAKKLRVKARQIKDNQLDMLKEKLAEFNTELLPGVIKDGDRSIPASSHKPKPKAHA